VVRLESEGFVQSFPRRGVRVVHLTLQDIAEIFELREALEAETVRLILAGTPERAGWACSRSSRLRIRGWPAAEYAQFNAADVALHDALAAALEIVACSRRSATCGCGFSGSALLLSKTGFDCRVDLRKRRRSIVNWWTRSSVETAPPKASFANTLHR